MSELIIPKDPAKRERLKNMLTEEINKNLTEIGPLEKLLDLGIINEDAKERLKKITIDTKRMMIEKTKIDGIEIKEKAAASEKRYLEEKNSKDAKALKIGRVLLQLMEELKD